MLILSMSSELPMHICVARVSLGNMIKGSIMIMLPYQITSLGTMIKEISSHVRALLMVIWKDPRSEKWSSVNHHRKHENFRLNYGWMYMEWEIRANSINLAAHLGQHRKNTPYWPNHHDHAFETSVTSLGMWTNSITCSLNLWFDYYFTTYTISVLDPWSFFRDNIA